MEETHFWNELLHRTICQRQAARNTGYDGDLRPTYTIHSSDSLPKAQPPSC